MIDFRTLAYFVTACRAESLAHAARDLGIAASTLSTALKALGEAFGLALFRRANNSFYPTGSARTLMRAAEPLLAAEAFARQLQTASPRVTPRRLAVDVGLAYTIGGVSKALRVAASQMAADQPHLFVDAQWEDERDLPQVRSLVDDWTSLGRSRVTIGPGPSNPGKAKHSANLLVDPWVFACRLPAGTRRPPSAAELVANRIVVPALAAPLIEHVERYFSRHKIVRVRFLDDHPGDLPRILEDHPEAALFVPRSLVSARLGLFDIATIAPDSPLATNLIADVVEPNATTKLFVQRLKRALESDARPQAERPILSLRQIHYFNTVHRLRRVSAAARDAHVSQPALSEQLHKLEAALDGPLFERRGDGVVPTAKGDRFAGLAAPLEAGFRRLMAGGAGVTMPQNRRIVAGILPSVNQHGFLINRITAALLDVQAQFPDLKLVVQEAPHGVLQEWVTRGQVGVAIVETAIPHVPRLPLGSSEGLAAITHVRHQLLSPGPVALADLARLGLALPTKRFGLRQLLETAAGERGVKIRPYMEIDSLPMAVSMLASLPVCTVLPPSAVAQEIARGDLVAHPIVEPAINRLLYVIYSGERSLSEPELSLVKALRSRLSER